MRNMKPMRKNRLIGLLCMLLAMQCLSAREKPGAPETVLSGFKERGENMILGAEYLADFFDCIRLSNRPVRVLHLGDSHVRGHVFSVETRHCLEHAWGDSAVYDDNITYKTTAMARETGKGGLVYHAFGVNGATYEEFNRQQIAARFDTLDIDLVILSFGTNEAHAPHFTCAWMEEELDKLLASLRSAFPHSAFLLTTPPGSYWKKKVRRKLKNGRRIYVNRYIHNEQVEQVAEAQVTYGATHAIPVWDLYRMAGGKDYACRNWRMAGLQRPDHVHYTREGYLLQGQLLAEAILKAYQEYETNHHRLSGGNQE